MGFRVTLSFKEQVEKKQRVGKTEKLRKRGDPEEGVCALGMT
jgi:hypothetical protein